RDALASMLNSQTLPSTDKFSLDVSCRKGELRVDVGTETLIRSGVEADDLFGRLIQSVLIQTGLRPLKANIPLSELKNRENSTDVRMLSLGGLGPEFPDIKSKIERDAALVAASRKLTSAVQEAWKDNVELHLDHVGAKINDRRIEVQ